MNWEQLRAILWLRWRLTRNQLTRGSGIGAVMVVLVGALLAIAAVGAGVGGLLIGALALKTASVLAIMLVWDGVMFCVLFFSLIAVLAELQRSESIDLTRLLHLPVGLRQVFVCNYLASLLSPGTVLALAGMLGLATGLAFSRGLHFLLALPLVLSFVFMVTVWIYGLRGWLLSLMVNPRRRRALIMWITIGIVALGQAPQLINLALQRKWNRNRATQRAGQTPVADPRTNSAPQVQPLPPPRRLHFADIAMQAHPWVPILWLPNGVRGLAAGTVLPALWGGVGMFGLGWFGLRRAYRATLRFYRAAEDAKPASPKAAAPKKAVARGNWVESRLPWVPEEVAAVAWAQFRSMTRAPEVRMMLGLGLFMSVFLPAMIFWRGGTATPLPATAKPFIGTLTVVIMLFSMLQLVCNQFGCDRDGFRSLVLLPTRRERVLLGKNLALLPLATGVALLPLSAVIVLVGLTPWMAVCLAMQFAAAFLLFCAVGNLSSILAPFRIAAGSLKPTKQSWRISLVMLLVHLLFPVVVAPVFIPPVLGWGAERFGWLPATPVSLVAALVLVAVFAGLYRVTLPPLGRLLQRRETQILQAVTEATE